MSSSFNSDHAKQQQQQSSTAQGQWPSISASRPRRGLTPISTASSSSGATTAQTSAATAGRPPSSSANPRNPWSPTNSLPSASNRQPTRSSSVSSTGGTFSPPPSLASTLHQTISSQSSLPSTRTRTSTSTNNTQFSTSAGNSQPVPSSRLSRTSPSLPSSSFSTPSSGGATNSGQSGQLSKIVIAQLFLLLSGLKDDGDKSKWETQAEQIRKLVESNGMEVFTKFFRRLLTSNASHIFNGSRVSEGGSGSYQMLVAEVSKISKEAPQAAKIAEAIDQGDENVFRDFDLSSFMEHFKMNATSKVILASAFRKASRADLRTKADAILSSNLAAFISALAKSTPISQDREDGFASPMLVGVVDRLAQFPPRNWTMETLQQLQAALQQHFSSAGSLIPLEIGSAMSMFDLMSPHNPLVRRVQRAGPKATESVELCKSILETTELQDISYQQVANTLLFMVIATDEPRYDPRVFISALREHRGGQRLDWQDVVHAFDREGVKITRDQFKGLFDALMILAREYENFDIQLLWGGDWHFAETQMSFASAFLSFSQEELDASKIPRLRKAYSKEDFQDASDPPEKIREFTNRAVRHPMVSLDASKALFNMVFRSSETYAHAQSLGVIEHVINPKMDLFVCSVCAVPKPWGALQDQAMKQLIAPMFLKNFESSGLVLHLLWKRDRQWMLTRLHQFYQTNPLNLPLIYEHAKERGWTEEIVAQNNELSLDLAAMAHGKGDYDLDQWLEQITRAMPGPRVLGALSGFLKTRAEDDISVHREGLNPTAVPLAVKTVHALLNFLGNSGLPEDEQVTLQRACIQAYPRLINYNEGFDHIIDANGQDSNAMSPEADARMQEFYKQMYSGEKQVRDIVEVLQRLKTSQDPGDQDLFACMIYGLFDEYSCFAEYPLDALATTAVLFGSIINFHLLSRIALKTALAMVLEAVREYPPTEAMYKFGLQALLHFKDRLDEWKMFSERLLHVPGLRGTQILPIVERVVREMREETNGVGDTSEQNEKRHVDDFLASETPEFSCLGVDPPVRPEAYQTPSNSIQESVLFILNNVSERNLSGKLDELRRTLQEEHFQWFANYLVDQRIRSQPNFHQLYMDMLEKLNEQILWAEVLRETYIISFRMLNADSTMNSSTERSQLKNIGAWLGAITLSRDKPIKHRNISFKDLLIEAHTTSRLLVAIPFTCTVLAAAAKSTIFKLPSAWTEETVGLLLELYDEGELKLSLKFEIEILSKALEVDMKHAERSTAIRDLRKRPTQDEEMLSLMAEGPEGLADMSVANFGRRGLMDRLTTTTLIPELAEFPSMLKHNYPMPGTNAVLQTSIRQVFNQATERAVHEIIGPVVDRSVTIAAISTSQLVAKDFALESDDVKYQEAAHTSVRKLAGSLALVTCKDPLKSSIQAHVRVLSQNLPNHIADGTVVMFINDNLDTICSIIEKAAEAAAVPEIDLQIEEAVQARRDGTFVPGELPRWNNLVPDPYKQTAEGLNNYQLAIYTEFGRSGRGGLAQTTSLSQENIRQLPDVLQDQFNGIHGLQAPSDVSSIQRQVNQFSTAQISASQTPGPQHGVNGYMESNKGIPELVMEIYRAAVEAEEAMPGRNLTEVEVIRNNFRQIINPGGAIASQSDAVLISAEREIFDIVYRENMPTSVTALLSHFLNFLCGKSEVVKQDFFRTFSQEIDYAFNADIVAQFVKCGLIELRLVDSYCAQTLSDGRRMALDFLDKFTDILKNDSGFGYFRADLVHSMTQLVHWISKGSDTELAQAIVRKLSTSPPLPPAPVAGDLVGPAMTQHAYIFDEWVRLLSNAPDSDRIAVFVRQLGKHGLIETNEKATNFVRTCIDICVRSFDPSVAEVKHNAPSTTKFARIDALAKLIISFVVHHNGDLPDDGSQTKARYFESLLLPVFLSVSFYHQLNVLNPAVHFRLMSSLLSEINEAFAPQSDTAQELLVLFGRSLRYVEPGVLPSFAFSWYSLLSHRFFLPILCSEDLQSWSVYTKLLTFALSYVGECTKAHEMSAASKELYRGTIKMLLVLHHDFPDYLADNHFELLNHIPVHCTQMRSLVISAATASFADLPDPFTDGLQVDRLDDSRRNPRVLGNVQTPLQKLGIIKSIDSYLREPSSAMMDNIVSVFSRKSTDETEVGFRSIGVHAVALHALSLYVVKSAESNESSVGIRCSAALPQIKLLSSLTERLSSEGRYYLINAIVNQLRYPNSHTNFFSFTLFHLWKLKPNDAATHEIQEQITRVLLERLIVHRPHPWGLIVTLLDLLKNPIYEFWNAPFIKANPDIDQMFNALYTQMGQNNNRA